MNLYLGDPLSEEADSSLVQGVDESTNGFLDKVSSK